MVGISTGTVPSKRPPPHSPVDDDRKRQRPDYAESAPSSTLFVKHLDDRATVDHIYHLFANCRGFVSCKVINTARGKIIPSVGIVQFRIPADVTEAFNTKSGAYICGRPVKLEFERIKGRDTFSDPINVTISGPPSFPSVPTSPDIAPPSIPTGPLGNRAAGPPAPTMKTAPPSPEVSKAPPTPSAPKTAAPQSTVQTHTAPRPTAQTPPLSPEISSAPCALKQIGSTAPPAPEISGAPAPPAQMVPNVPQVAAATTSSTLLTPLATKDNSFNQTLPTVSTGLGTQSGQPELAVLSTPTASTVANARSASIVDNAPRLAYEPDKDPFNPSSDAWAQGYEFMLRFLFYAPPTDPMYRNALQSLLNKRLTQSVLEEISQERILGDMQAEGASPGHIDSARDILEEELVRKVAWLLKDMMERSNVRNMPSTVRSILFPVPVVDPDRARAPSPPPVLGISQQAGYAVKEERGEAAGEEHGHAEAQTLGTKESTMPEPMNNKIETNTQMPQAEGLSNSVSSLNHDVSEFVDSILRSGVPSGPSGTSTHHDNEGSGITSTRRDMGTTVPTSIGQDTMQTQQVSSKTPSASIQDQSHPPERRVQAEPDANKNDAPMLGRHALEPPARPAERRTAPRSSQISMLARLIGKLPEARAKRFANKYQMDSRVPIIQQDLANSMTPIMDCIIRQEDQERLFFEATMLPLAYNMLKEIEARNPRGVLFSGGITDPNRHDYLGFLNDLNSVWMGHTFPLTVGGRKKTIERSLYKHLSALRPFFPELPRNF